MSIMETSFTNSVQEILVIAPVLLLVYLLLSHGVIALIKFLSVKIKVLVSNYSKDNYSNRQPELRTNFA